VFSVPFEFKCSACGREPTAAGWSLCALCGGFFCSDHLIVKKGVATCESCAVERERREASSGVSTGDEDRVVALIRADVEATIGPGHGEPIVEAAARHRLHVGNPVGYVDKVVDDVQQYFHDAFVDTVAGVSASSEPPAVVLGRVVALRTHRRAYRETRGALWR